MIQLFVLILLQLIIAGIVVLVLMKFLDRELQQAAIEKLFSIKVTDGIAQINVYHARELPIKIKEELQQLTKNKFTDSKIIFEQNQIIKGGLVITVGDQVLDFSIANRLENFWS